MNDKMELLQAIAVTAELTGAKLSEAAVGVMITDLQAYPADAVLAALERCRRDLRGRLTLSEIISRIDDGRPGVEEAWSMVPRDEYKSIVWTDEMAQAWQVACQLLDDGDEIAARMAFKETYQRIVSDAKVSGKLPVWSASLGYDKEGREPALFAAAEKGRITAQHALALLPHNKPSNRLIALLPSDEAMKLLKAPEIAPETPRVLTEEAKNAIAKLKAFLEGTGAK